MPTFETPSDDKRLSHEAYIAKLAETAKNTARKRAERARAAKGKEPGRRPSRRDR